MHRWLAHLYPELSSLPDSRRDHVWRLANAEAFLPSEFVLILVAVACAAFVVRDAGFRIVFGNGVLAFAADYVSAGSVLLLIAGPVFWRRTKRGLAKVLHNLVTLQMLAEELHYLVVYSHMEGPAIEPFGVRANRSGLQKTAWREEGCMACARDRVELDPRPKRFLN